MYLGATIALLSDISPSKLTVPCVAVFSLFSTIIATLVQLLIPFLKGVFDSLNSPHLFIIYAAPYAPPQSLSSAGNNMYRDHRILDDIRYRVSRTGADGLQSAMLYSLGSIYIFSALLYVGAYVWLCFDLGRNHTRL